MIIPICFVQINNVKTFETFACEHISNDLLVFPFSNLIWTNIHNHIYIYGLFGDILLNHDLRLHVGCDYTYAIKIILIVNVNYNYFIISNWNHKLIFFNDPNKCKCFVIT